MQQEQNYYEILGVSRDATSEEIKKAYHRLARQYHPDVNPDDERAAERFKQVNQAYQVLFDPMQRSLYDRQLGKPGIGININTQSLTAEEYYQRGYEKSQKGDYRGAIADYNEALEINPNLAEVYCYRGFANYKLGDERASSKDYTRALELNPNLAEVYYYRGLSRIKLGYIQAAIEDYTQALEKKPDFASVYYQRGLAYAEIEDRENAIADLEKAAQLFHDRGDRSSSQMAMETIRSLSNFSWKNLGDRFQTAFKDAWQAARVFGLNPGGGLLPAFAKLDKQRAMAVSILYAVIFDVCFSLGMGLFLGRSGRAGLGYFLVLIIIGIIPFINLTVASGFARVIFRSSGSFSGDLFIAGASLLPLAALVLISALLNYWALGAIIGVFAISYMMLTLYTGCHQISNISESKSALIMPIMLLLAALPFGLVAG
jgi:curved DNA-binding protein CbpA